jgi:hypothetical protein
MLQPITKPISSDVYELVYGFEVFAGGWYVAIKAGFRTDGASIPRLFWRVIGHPFQGDYLGPAVVHDALYQSEALTRAQADSLLYDLLLANGVGRCRAWTIYRGVRMFGWAAWNDRNNAAVSAAKQLVEVHHV